MSESFTLAPDRCAVLTDPKLRLEIETHTANAAAASGILRSIERFGTDDAILFFEMTPRAGTRTVHTAASTAWTVRAVRSDSPVPVIPEIEIGTEMEIDPN